jgi:hypothetical protein
MGQGPTRWDEKLIFPKKLSSTTHRQPTAVGFLFPSLPRGSTKPSHMHNEIESPVEEMTSLHDDDLHRITLLTGLYLTAGLPLDLAAQSAAADYSMFEEAALCA